jgi:hypothetical protein
MRRALALAAALAGWLLLPGFPSAVSATSTVPYSFNWAGGMTAPVTWNGQGQAGGTWDVLVHKRGTGDDMQPSIAQHGADCSPPPGVHLITTLADSVFICRNHVMTSITDRGYGAAVMVPDHMADFTNGTSAITFSTTSVHVDARDYFDIWITPFADNMMVPLTDGVDVQGPPKNAVRVRDCFCGNNTDTFTASTFSNFVETALPQSGGGTLQRLVTPSSTVRTPFELDISRNHLRFGLAGTNVSWVDSAINLGWSRGVVQIIHHSYDACKDQATSNANPCVADTWHWSNFGISQSMPFTIINGDVRSVSAQSGTTVHFAAPAPSNAFLRFEALSAGLQVSYDGGATFQAARAQAMIGDHGSIHADHFSPYFTPIPAGAKSVVFRGQNWYGGPWFVRDPAIWADQSSPAPASTPTPGGVAGTPTPTSTATPVGRPTPTPTPHHTSTPTPVSGGPGEHEPPAPGEHDSIPARLVALLQSPSAPGVAILTLFAVCLFLFLRFGWKNT